MMSQEWIDAMEETLRDLAMNLDMLSVSMQNDKGLFTFSIKEKADRVDELLKEYNADWMKGKKEQAN